MGVSDFDGRVEARPGRSLWLKKRVTAPPSKLVALFLHGGCANLQQWREQEPVVFSHGLTTVMLDAFGCGKSDKPRIFEAYHPEELYKDVKAIFQTIFKDGKKVVVIGHSFGSALALRLASEHPSEVVGLVLVGPYTPAKEARKASFFSLAAWLFYFPAWLLAWMQPSLTEGFLRAAFHRHTWQNQPDLVEQERKYSNANPPHMFRAFHRQISGWVTPAEYCRWAESTPHPVAVVYGDSDGITPFFSSSKLLMQNLRQAQLTVVDNASHQVMQENPDTVNAVILDLLQKVRT